MDRLALIAVIFLAPSASAQEGTSDGGMVPAPAPAAGKPAAGTAERPALDLALMPFTQETVKRVVAHNQPKIQTCYEETLAGKDKPVEGRVMTSFVVTPEGLVKKARVLSKGTTLKDPKLHACVVDALGTFTFPKPSDRRDHPVEYPFNLKAVR